MTQLNQIPTRMSAPQRNIDLNALRDFVAKLNDTVAILAKDLDFIVNGNLDANNIRANSIETKNLKADSVTADKIMVNELSAITAKLGKIISGELYSAYIATSESNYPRVVIDPTGNYIGIYTSATAYMEIKPGITGGPTVTGYEGGDLKYILGTIFGIPNYQSIDSLDIRAGSSLTLACGSGAFDNVKIPSWDKLYSNGDVQTLADALNNLASSIAGKANKGSSTGLAGSANAGIPIGTQLMVSGGGIVTWNGIPSHTHNQI